MSYGYYNGCRCAACTSKHYQEEQARKDAEPLLKAAIRQMQIERGIDPNEYSGEKK